VVGGRSSFHQEKNPILFVPRNDVAGPRNFAADRVTTGTQQFHTIGTIAKRYIAGEVGANQVVLNEIGASYDEDAILTVPRDEVAGTSHRTAHCVEERSISDFDPVGRVPQSFSSGGVGADVVSFNHVAGGLIHRYPVSLVARDEVAGLNSRASNGRVVVERDN